jgi:hypothetical protein
MPWADAYLAELRKDHTLCLPQLDLPALADRLSLPLATLRVRRQRNEALRAAEREIIAEHMGRLKAEALRAGQPVLTGEEEDLPPHLERYLALYTDPANEGTYDQRFKALRALQNEGVPIEWSDILAAQEQLPAFKAAMDRHWQEGHIEVEDTLRKDARKGTNAARRMYLMAENPSKYGNKVKVEVDHRHQLAEGDEKLVAEVKGRIGSKPRPAVSYEDVVEGEVLAP